MPRKPPLRLTLLACLVGAMHLYVLLSALIHHTYLTDDSIQYLTIAEHLSEAGIFSQSLDAPLVADLQRTPGYPVFLLLMGRWPVAILLVQHLLVLVSAWLLYRIGTQLYGRSVASACAKVYLLQPYPVILASYVLSETLFIALLLLGLWGFLRFWKGEGPLPLAWGLAALAMGALVRPVAVPLLFIAMAISLLRILRLPGRRISQIAVACLIPVLLVGPWYLRNHALSGRWSISTMGEMGMLHGRLGGLEAWRSGQKMEEHSFYMAGDSVAAQEGGLLALRRYPAGKQTHETEELGPGMTSLAISFFLEHPLDGMCFVARNFWEMFKGVGYGWAKELTLSKTMASVAATVQLVFNLLMYLGLLLALVRWREWQAPEFIFWGLVCIVLLLSAAAWADGRYRMVVDPVLMLLMMFVLHRQEKLAPVLQ